MADLTHLAQMPGCALDDIRRRAAAAAPGPWTDLLDVVAKARAQARAECTGPLEQVTVWLIRSPADFEFIAHARQDVPALLDAVDALRGEVNRLQAEVNRLKVAEGASR